MNRYAVHFKNKKDAFYEAESYELKGERYVFYKSADKSDEQSFALASEVRGIDLIGEAEGPVLPIMIER